MSIVLPKEIAYNQSLPALPSDVVNTSVVLAPVNGSTFGENSLLQFDLPQRGYLDPSTLYIRYKFAIAGGAINAEMKGTPVYTPFVKLETIFGSSIVESIQNFGQLQNMLANITLNDSQKDGLSSAYGWTDYATASEAGNLNGRSFAAAAESAMFAGPLNCILSSAEKLVPLGLMPNVRIQLTTDSIANIFTTTVAAPTSITLSNVELCFDMIDFGGAVDNIVKGMGEKIYIKSQSWTSTGNTLASGVSGTVELMYNQRLSSIKSLFTNFGGAFATSLNKQYDSYDCTSNNGSLQYNIAGTMYPTREVSTVNNKAAFIMELKQAVGGIHSLATNNFSISPNEFTLVGIGSSTYRIPAKFWFGVNTEKLSTSGNLLTGVSTMNSAISLRINLGTATPGAYNVQLICLYDALIEIDTVSRNASVKQ